MTKREAIDVLQKHKMCEMDACPATVGCNVCPYMVKERDVIEANEIALETLIRADEREHADGCAGCAFAGRDEWIDPCKHCKRNMADRWRKAK